jgi:hypothetical protein
MQYALCICIICLSLHTIRTQYILYYLHMHIMHIFSAISISIYIYIYICNAYIICNICIYILYYMHMDILQIICIICLGLHTKRITRRYAATSSAQFNCTTKMRQTRLNTGLICVRVPGTPSIRQHTSAYVSIICVRGPGTPNRICQGAGFAGFLNECMREGVAV